MPLATGQDWLHGKEYKIGLDIGSKLNLTAKTDKFEVDYISVMLSFFPENSKRQQVLSFITVPEAKKNNHHYEFKWVNPEEGNYEFGLNAEIKINNDIQRITNKISFPISVDDEFNQWLISSEHIDSNDSSIIRQASAIAEGSNDLYYVVYKLADWINKNVKYDVSYGESVEKASTVLADKKGTCDEYTSLLVAMCRSLGIPAKYIAGLAYSNIPEIEGFSPHAWAEIYFPGYGWVPFDATYGQLGFVDASHIVLKEAFDPAESSTTYEWKGLDADLYAEKLRMNADLINTSGTAGPYISLNVKAIKSKVGFGSYNLIEADIENLNNCYISTEVYIAKPTELKLIGVSENQVLLKPNEKKKVYWIVKVPETLRSDSIYTFPIKITSLRNVSAETEFSSSASDKKYSLNEMEERKEISEEGKTLAKKVELNCSTDKTVLLENESIQIKCSVKNTGNVFLDNLAVCMNTLCKHIDLGIHQTKKIDFPFKAKNFGRQEVTMKVSNDKIYTSTKLEFDVFDAPKIKIDGLDYPEKVEYGDNFSIRFNVNKLSVSNPYGVVIKIIQDGYKRKWELDELSEDMGFVVNLKGSDLDKGKNNFKLLIDFEDIRKNKYSEESEFSITLEKVNFLQTIKIWFNKAARIVEGLFTR
ncbi:hypothetical protein DRN85_10640 [Methanosarcinales archaeon]|nr:MAG: hypothetical protein DRN85_10640 [Methanosarcinales archaeon]